MPNGALNIVHNFAGESQFIICEWVKSTAQATPVIGHVSGTGLGAQEDTDQTEVYYPAAHSQQQLQITELPAVWFVVRFWRSADGISKDVLLLELAGNARTGAVYPIERFVYVVDRGDGESGIWQDPVQDDTGIRDTRLLDGNYWVEERGTGSLIPVTEVTDRSDAGGGFDFTVVDKVMNSGGVYIVTLIHETDAGGGDSGTVDGDDDILILNTDQDYDPLTMSGRTLIADYPGTVGILNILALALVPDGRFTLQTQQGAQNNVIIQLDAGDTVWFRGEQVNKIILGKGETITILIKNNVLYVLNPVTNHDRLGLRLWADKLLLNTFFQDGSTYNQADYPRAVELLDSLPAGAVVSYATWNTSVVQPDGQTTYPNKGKWARDDSAGTFRVPDIRDQSVKALSAVDGSIVAGRYGHQTLMNHGHYMGSPVDSGGNPYLSTNHNTGGNFSYGLNGSTTAPSQFQTGDPIGIGGALNAVNNIGQYPLICI